jgi:hypothetical protein
MGVASVLCPQGHGNPNGQKFCGQCGSALAGLCPNGHRSPDGQKFCGECGQRVPDTSEPNFTGPLWAAGAAERSKREANAEQPSSSQTAQRAAERVSGITDSPTTKSTFNKRNVLIGGGVLGLLVVFTLWIAGISDEQASKRSDKSSSSSGRTTQGSSTLLEDWIPAVCVPGTFFQGGDLLPNADGQAFCKSLRNDSIVMGQYNSEFEAKNDLNIFRNAEYATIAGSGGRIQVFISPAARNVLTPLQTFGSSVGVVR